MEALRWWLLLLTALMFSMSGCASHEWTIWATNPAHFASAHRIAFSMKSHPTEASRVGDTIYGRIVGSPAPTILVLERQPQ